MRDALPSLVRGALRTLPWGLLLAVQLACSSGNVVSSTGGSASNGTLDGGAQGNDGSPPADANTRADADSPKFLVFVTKATFRGSFGGLSTADGKCQDFADAAGLGGKYRAWLSVDGEAAISRVPEGGPWKLVGTTGAIAFTNRAQWRGYPTVDLTTTELGTASTGNFWTGTDLGGMQAGAAPHPNCSNWTSASLGAVGAAGNGKIQQDNQVQSWSNGFGYACNGQASLLCFQYE